MKKKYNDDETQDDKEEEDDYKQSVILFVPSPPLPSHGQQDYYDNPSHAIMHAWAMMMASFFTAALMQCNRGYG